MLTSKLESAQGETSSGKQRLRVLIVEDHAPTRAAMGKLIRSAGGDVTSARDGEEALGYLFTNRFDVLLTDLQMPVMNGIELIAHVHNLPESHRPSRIIAISGQYEAGVLTDHMVQFMPKPLNMDTLLRALGGMPN